MVQILQADNPFSEGAGAKVWTPQAAVLRRAPIRQALYVGYWLLARVQSLAPEFHLGQKTRWNVIIILIKEI